MRYLRVGGRRQRRFDGTSLQPRELPENAATPTRRVHAVLGGFFERQAASLKTRTTAELTKLWHEHLSLTMSEKHNLSKRSRVNALSGGV